MTPCLIAKKSSSDTDLMFQFYLPYWSILLYNDNTPQKIGNIV